MTRVVCVRPVKKMSRSGIVSALVAAVGKLQYAKLLKSS